MAGERQEAPWPLPNLHFRVTIGDLGEIAFQEVNFLNTEYDVVEYRAGNSKEYLPVKMPVLRKSSDVSLKKGMFRDDSALFDYFNQVRMNTIARQTVVIQLLDEEHNSIFTWMLRNAFPRKLIGPMLNAQASEVAIEELVLAHEGLSFEKA